MSRYAALLTLSLLAVSGCKKEETSTAAPEEAARPEWGAQIPADATSQEFAGKLVRTEIQDLSISDSGAVLVYRSLKFAADGSWSSNGDVTIEDEAMECTESGTWTMDAAESANVAGVTWTIKTTNCAGRAADTEQRTQITIDGEKYSVKFR